MIIMRASLRALLAALALASVARAGGTARSGSSGASPGFPLVAPGWAGVLRALSPAVERKAARHPELSTLKAVCAQIASRLAEDEAAGLRSMEFVFFLPKKYQAEPASFASRGEAAQIAILAKGVEKARRALEREAKLLRALKTARTATPADVARLAAIGGNGFYLSPASRASLEKALDSLHELASRQPLGQGAAFDNAGPLAAPGEKGPPPPVLGAERRHGSGLDPRGRLYKGETVTTGLPHGDPKLPRTIKLPSGARFGIRRAAERDVSEVTKLIHDAFEVWKEQGLRLGPMFQTDQQTRRHLLAGGIVAQNSAGEVVGTFSLDVGEASLLPDGNVSFREGSDSPATYLASGAGVRLPAGRLLVFKKAAVRRDLAGSGLGRRLYGLAERTGRDGGYAGMALETVKEAAWLYDWYRRLGFKPIGAYRYPGGELDTVLMIKPFRSR